MNIEQGNDELRRWPHTITLTGVRNPARALYAINYQLHDSTFDIRCWIFLFILPDYLFHLDLSGNK